MRKFLTSWRFDRLCSNSVRGDSTKIAPLPAKQETKGRSPWL